MNSHAQFNTIAQLDLDPIKVKLMHKESGEGWSLDRANAVEFEYRRFLCLMKLFPHEQTAPLFDVDIFWHYHILDTMKYAQDCEQVFGYFLHHFPYVGLRGGDDDAVHDRAGARMQQLYEATFGEPYIAEDQAATGEQPSSVAAQTAYSIAALHTGHGDAARSTPAIGKTAYSIAAVHAGCTDVTRPALGTVKTAYSIAAVQNDAVYSVRPALGGAKTAYSIAAINGDSVFAVRPALAIAA